MNYIEEVESLNVIDSLLKAKLILQGHLNTVVSISGGSDSDIVLDLIQRTKGDNDKITYVWYDTGLEYQATKDHLIYLENKYGIKINRIKAIKPIPTCCREFGIPFLSKYASTMISRLQKHNFKFEDKPYEELIAEYPKCIAAVKWWCNKGSDKVQQYNIANNKYLKEFMIQNPPPFRVSNSCCEYAKKKPVKKFIKEIDADLNVYGVRAAEGGIRATAYDSCFNKTDIGADQYRPLFFWNDEDKRCYERKFDIRHSDCYAKYGLKRTGCVGCPYGRNVLDELNTVKMFEPKLYKACMKVFGASYEYTKKYRQFCAEMKVKENTNEDQLSLFDMFYDFTG